MLRYVRALQIVSMKSEHADPALNQLWASIELTLVQHSPWIVCKFTCSGEIRAQYVNDGAKGMLLYEINPS